MAGRLPVVLLWHMHQPDGIYTGVLRALGWQPAHPDAPIFDIPPTTLADLATFKPERIQEMDGEEYTDGGGI